MLSLTWGNDVYIATLIRLDCQTVKEGSNHPSFAVAFLLGSGTSGGFGGYHPQIIQCLTIWVLKHFLVFGDPRRPPQKPTNLSAGSGPSHWFPVPAMALAASCAVRCQASRSGPWSNWIPSSSSIWHLGRPYSLGNIKKLVGWKNMIPTTTNQIDIVMKKTNLVPFLWITISGVESDPWCVTFFLPFRIETAKNNAKQIGDHAVWVGL